MPTVHFVKAARKDNPAVNKCEPYYWWEFRYGPKRYSKTYPPASQLTQSPFLSGWRVVEETLEANEENTDLEALRELMERMASDLRTLGEEAKIAQEAMPENLQYSETGQRLEARADLAGEWADSLESIDLDWDKDVARAEAEEDDPPRRGRLGRYVRRGLARTH